MTGKYAKPNWMIGFIALDSKNSKLDQSYEQYSCLAQIISVDEFLEQSQIDIQDLSQSFSEGEILDKTNTEKENITDMSISEGER